MNVGMTMGGVNHDLTVSILPLQQAFRFAMLDAAELSAESGD